MELKTILREIRNYFLGESNNKSSKTQERFPNDEQYGWMIASEREELVPELERMLNEGNQNGTITDTGVINLTLGHTTEFWKMRVRTQVATDYLTSRGWNVEFREEKTPAWAWFAEYTGHFYISKNKSQSY